MRTTENKSTDTVVALIIGRQNSVRIPGKNVRLFCGYPLVSYPIKSAINSGLFDEIFVSSDDPDMLRIATDFRLSPINRPDSLSDERTTTIPVVRHAIEVIEESRGQISQLCCLYAANPFVEPVHIRDGYQHLVKGHSAFVFSAVEFSYPIERAFTLDGEDSVHMINSSAYQKRTQDCQRVYHDGDLFYWGQRWAWMHEEAIFGPRSTALSYPRGSIFPIDNVEDWHRAEAIFESSKKIRDHD